MQFLPAFAPHTADPAAGGRNRQGQHTQESGESGKDEPALNNVQPDLMEIEKLVDSKPGQEVQAGIEKGEQPDHAPETDEVGQVEEFAQRRDGQGRNDEADGPVSG